MSLEQIPSPEQTQPITQVDFTRVAESYKEQLSENQLKRAELAYTVINHAFMLLGYRKADLPYILFLKSGNINGEKRVGSFWPNGAKGFTEDPAIFLYIGKEIMKQEQKSIIKTEDGKQMMLTTITDNKNPYTNLLEFVAAVLEETHHYVFRSNIGKDVLPAGHPDYAQQPHEVAAKQFVKETVLQVTLACKEYMQYYGADAKE